MSGYKRKLTAGLFIILLCILPYTAFAQKIPDLHDPPLVDEAGILKPHEAGAVKTYLLQISAGGAVQMIVYIPKSLQGYDIESFSIACAEKWRPGEKGKDTGLLLIVAPSERQMRLEVGYGLEHIITDAHAKRILSDYLVPYFREGRYGDGIMTAIEIAAAKTGTNIKAPVENRLSGKKPQQSSRGSAFGLLRLILLFFVFSMFFAGRIGIFGLLGLSGLFSSSWGGGRRWGGGGSSGFGGFGGFSGGGGGFGGGGASARW